MCDHEWREAESHVSGGRVFYVLVCVKCGARDTGWRYTDGEGRATPTPSLKKEVAIDKPQAQSLSYARSSFPNNLKG
jgi:hypothetical protein